MSTRDKKILKICMLTLYWAVNWLVVICGLIDDITMLVIVNIFFPMGICDVIKGKDYIDF